MGDQMRRAAELIRAGRLVAFPTETVYGLGANALDAQAVARIFAAKGRPATSPLIVHVASIEMARELASEWPATAEALARRYWPGPLTLVLRKQPQVPDIVTAGLGTVGLRMPSHPIALELIRQSGLPIAAPSANPFSRISPTTAAHVREGLGDAVDLILDGGPTEVGIESTVLSLAGTPTLLRPGMISQQAIEEWIGPVKVTAVAGEGSHPAPGMHRRHYSPRTPLVLVRCGHVPEQGRGVYLGFAGQPAGLAPRMILMPLDAAKYAATLYKMLHQLDQDGLDWIAVELPPDEPEWAGIADRLRRAAAK
jgi:L-threonylcarbamoyladenylate synthase